MGSSFAKRFNQALSQREKSMADISRETGISRASLSQYSSGKYTPRQDRIYLIANALQVSPAWLTGFNTEMEDKPSKEKADNVIYTDEDFSLSSKTRQLKNGAEDFIGDQLLSLTEPARPSREEILKWFESKRSQVQILSLRWLNFNVCRRLQALIFLFCGKFCGK